MRICENEIRVEGRLLRIGRLEGDKYVFLSNPETMLDALRRSGAHIDIFTFLQRLPDTSAQFDFPMEWDNLAVLEVSTFDHWWNHQIRFKARNKARQAEKKGVQLREVPFDDSLVRGIWEIYNESPIRQGRRFPHYGKDLETVRREAATFLDSSIFIGAFIGHQLIGFAKLTADQTRTQANLMNIVSLIRSRDKAPTNALIAYAVRACAERQIRYLVYSKFSYRKRLRDTLSDFKESNGFERVNLPRYFVPLTTLGFIALRLGLHHSFFDHLPTPVASKLREVRNAWYNRKLRVLADAS